MNFCASIFQQIAPKICTGGMAYTSVDAQLLFEILRMLTKAMTSAQSAAPIVSDSSTHPGQLLLTGSVVHESTNIEADIAALHLQLADCQLTARLEISDLMSQLKAAIQRQHVVQHLQAKLAEVEHSRQLISDMLQEIHWKQLGRRQGSSHERS